MNIVYTIQCACEECAENSDPLWLSRAERPEKGTVRFPSLGVFDFQPESSGNRVTFESKEIAQGLLALLQKRQRSVVDRIVKEVQISEGQMHGRLEGR